jgi:hypothetical protein
MIRLLARLKGARKWPSATATVFDTEEVGKGGRAGLTMNIYFNYDAGTSMESGKVFVDDSSSLYGLAKGEQFTLQYDPARPSCFYSSEAASLSQTIRTTVVICGAVFAVLVFLIEFFGRR